MSKTLDSYWKEFTDRYEDKYAEYLSCSGVINNLARNGLSNCPNLLMYSAGFPMKLVWTSLLTRVFGPFTPKDSKIWEDDVVFQESAFHFEIDMALPSQSRNLGKITSFLKNIVTHKCIHNDRHIIVLSNIEHLLKSDKAASQMFRVILERFSSNVMFICTTNCVSSIEPPLLSRFTIVRVSSFTSKQIHHILTDIGLPLPPVGTTTCRNIAQAIYLSYTSNTSQLRYPFILEIYQQAPSIEQTRALAHKLYAYDVSIGSLVTDLTLICNKDYRCEIVSLGAKIDHLLAQTDGNRKPLYIEYFLNAVNGMGAFSW